MGHIVYAVCLFICHNTVTTKALTKHGIYVIIKCNAKISIIPRGDEENEYIEG